MDYYARKYPLNSQLQYSSSHVFTVVSQYNREVVLEKGEAGSYNQNYFSLPDSSYLLYGVSAFTLNSQTNSSLFSLMVNMGKNSYWAISPSSSVQAVTLSADIFIKNIMQLCNAKQKEVSLVPTISKSAITPKIAAYTAVDVTQLVPLTELTPNNNAVVYRFGVGSSVNKQIVTFTSTFTFTPPSTNGYIRLELLVFEKVTMPSLVENNEYSVRMSANNEDIVNYRFVYRNTPNISFKSATFQKAVKVLAATATVDLTISFSSSTTSQELYVLLGSTYQSIIYDPITSQCVSSCPTSSSGVNGDSYPLTCVYCKS